MPVYADRLCRGAKGLGGCQADELAIGLMRSLGRRTVERRRECSRCVQQTNGAASRTLRQIASSERQSDWQGCGCGTYWTVVFDEQKRTVFFLKHAAMGPRGCGYLRERLLYCAKNAELRFPSGKR